MILREVSGNLDLTQTLLKICRAKCSKPPTTSQFEKAALLRDQIRELKRGMAGETVPGGNNSASPSHL
jgi:protein-arginine kinase activator protein McsA